MPITQYQPAVHAANYLAMACHVFALSGDPLTIAAVNTRYDLIGQYLTGGAIPPAGSTISARVMNAMAEIGDDQRVATLALLRDEFGMAPGNGTNIRIWGLFRNHLQMLPEHMWITKAGRIYDTMPHARIRRNNNNQGRNPPSERYVLDAGIIFSVEVAALHVEQLSIINSPNWA